MAFVLSSSMSQNPQEVDAVLDCAKQFDLQSKQYKIVTGYSSQRTRIEAALKQAGLAWTGVVHTLDTIQGPLFNGQ